MVLSLSITVGAVIFVAFILAALFGSLNPANVAADYRPCAGGWYEARANDCHLGLTKIPQQPVNTYSNLAYLAAGFFVAHWLQTPPSFAFAVTMAYLCIGSALYHATSTSWGGMLDVTAIYAVFSALAVFAASALIGGPVWVTVIAMLVVSGAIAYAFRRRYNNRMQLVIGVFLGLTYLLLILHMWIDGAWGPWRWAVASFGAFLLAFVIWSFDKKQNSPFGRLGHGLWHLFTAAACGMLYYAVHLTS